MAARLELPEGVDCKLCPKTDVVPRTFQILGGHLYFVHSTNSQEYRQELGLEPKTPLHTKQYSDKRRKVGLQKSNLRRVTAFRDFFYNRRQEATALLANQGYYTTGKAAEKSDLNENTFRNAIDQKRLTAYRASLITYRQTPEGNVQTLKLPGVTVDLIPKDLLNEYTSNLNANWRRKRVIIDNLASQGFFTTGKASQITGLSYTTFEKAIRENRLDATQVCLIENKENENSGTRRVSGPNLSLIQTESLENYLTKIRSGSLREKALSSLRKFFEQTNR